MGKKENAPVELVIISLIVILSLTIIYRRSSNIFFTSFSFIGILVSIIAICNIAYKKGLEKNNK